MQESSCKQNRDMVMIKTKKKKSDIMIKPGIQQRLQKLYQKNG